MSLRPAPLIIDGQGPLILPACPLLRRLRGRRQLAVLQRTIYLKGPDGRWHRIPIGYVTDWGSIPTLASVLTLTDLEPYGEHALAALGHDWNYAIGEAGMKTRADDLFRAQMKLDGVPKVRREVMYQAVHLFGGAGYAKARTWWETENFADPETGEYPVAPPFRREEAFSGQRWGARARPDWGEALLAA